MRALRGRNPTRSIHEPILILLPPLPAPAQDTAEVTCPTDTQDLASRALLRNA